MADFSLYYEIKGKDGNRTATRQISSSVSSLSLYEPPQLGLPFSIHSIFLARFHFLTAFRNL